MAEIKRAILFGKLNPIAYKAVESATIFCKMRGNPYVELVHWIFQLLQLADSDLHRILKHFAVNSLSAGHRSHGSAGQTAARSDLDHRLLTAPGRGGRTWLGLWLAPVWGKSCPHRSRGGRATEDAKPPQRLSQSVERILEYQGRDPHG